MTLESRVKFRRLLLDWYARCRRSLPWRETSDPYRIWLSEVMLQQTRAATVVPYYQRFLDRFPDVSALAAAPEPDLLAAWAGLGYYTRARNLQRAARRVVDAGGFPSDYDSIRALPGIGDYTAAAIASIAFGLPHAVLDGNVMRVVARLRNDTGDLGSAATRRRLAGAARRLLDTGRPGDFNQAVMELGATVCLPRAPRCSACPVTRFCRARAAGTQEQLPVKIRRAEPVRQDKTLLLVERNGRLLLRLRPGGEGRLGGFWELPEKEQIPGARICEFVCDFRHTITHHIFKVSVRRAEIGRVPASFRWVTRRALVELPLTTATRKALAGASAESAK